MAVNCSSSPNHEAMPSVIFWAGDSTHALELLRGFRVGESLTSPPPLLHSVTPPLPFDLR